MPSFSDLPFEIVSEILSIAAVLNANAHDAVTYSYGLTEATRPMQTKAKTQKYLRGRVPTDVLRWNSVDSIRRVNWRFHEWALSFALKELYIRRWQGGEVWMKRALENHSPDSNAAPVVYQSPYKSVKATATLFHDYPSLALHVRKIWFNGIHRFDTIGWIFKILSHCHNVRTATLPWTTLRYGSLDDWKTILSFPRLTSLEFLAVPLKNEICAIPESHDDTAVLRSGDLDFGNLRRLKIFGDSNIQPITDADLSALSRTATKLEEILIMNVTTITATGVASLVAASRDSLKLLEFIPLENNGMQPPTTTRNAGEGDRSHICALLASCPKLADLAVTLPSACPDLFSNPSVQWKETIRVRVGSRGVDNIIALLNSARSLLEKRSNDDDFEIEIAVGPYLFETKRGLVHGSFAAAKAADGADEWCPREWASVKGPYGYTGLYAGARKGEWTAVAEEEFWEGVGRGLVGLS